MANATVGGVDSSSTSAGLIGAPEWRSFEDDSEDPSRVGAPLTHTLHDRGLSTRIGWRDRDANGNSLPSKKRKRLARLRTWNKRFRTRDRKDESLKSMLSEVHRLAAALNVPKPERETAALLCRRASEADLLAGRSLEGVATAAVYAAVRLAGLPRHVDEVASASRVDNQEVKHTYLKLARAFELELPPPDPRLFLREIASEVGLSVDTRQQAQTLLDQAVDQHLHIGKDPAGVAAGASYAACQLTGESITQAEVAAATDVHANTIRHRYRELLDAADTQASGTVPESA